MWPWRDASGGAVAGAADLAGSWTAVAVLSGRQGTLFHGGIREIWRSVRSSFRVNRNRLGVFLPAKRTEATRCKIDASATKQRFNMSTWGRQSGHPRHFDWETD